MNLFTVLEKIGGNVEIEVEVFNKTVENRRIYKGKRNGLFKELINFDSKLYKLGGREIHDISPLWTKDSSGIRIIIEH